MVSNYLYLGWEGYNFDYGCLFSNTSAQSRPFLAFLYETGLMNLRKMHFDPFSDFVLHYKVKRTPPSSQLSSLNNFGVMCKNRSGL